MPRELHTTIHETHPTSEENSAQLQTSDLGLLHHCMTGFVAFNPVLWDIENITELRIKTPL
jgi:hypothetical protein